MREEADTPHPTLHVPLFSLLILIKVIAAAVIDLNVSS